MHTANTNHAQTAAQNCGNLKQNILVKLKLENDYSKLVLVPAFKAHSTQYCAVRNTCLGLINQLLFLRFDFIKCHLTNSYGMFNMTLLLSSCPAWDCFLESSDTFIKSLQKVTQTAK